MEGWVKLHRTLQKWEWYNDSQTLHIFLTILLNANHESGRWRGVAIKKGQWITGRKQLSALTNISEQSIRTILKRLVKTGELTIIPTNRFSLITVVKWDSYQIDENESTSTSTNNQPATNQQLTTNKNEENEKNEKKNISDRDWLRDELHKMIGRTMNANDYKQFPVILSYSREQIEAGILKSTGTSINYLITVLQNTAPPKKKKEHTFLTA